MNLKRYSTDMIMADEGGGQGCNAPLFRLSEILGS